MKRVAVIGLGLMGASLGLALKARGFGGRVAGYARRAATREAALAQGSVDEVHDDPAQAVQDADLVVYCTPILTIPDLVAVSVPHLKAGAIVTDVGSTKAELERQIVPQLADSAATFVGSHPVAGSEQQGLDAARADLYDGAMVIVTPPPATSASPAVEQVRAFWSQLGAWVEVMSATEHDRLMARTSHLPHLVASVLALTVGREGEASRTGRYCGTGFRDTSRIADGSPDVWHDIVHTNRTALAGELAAFRDALTALIDQLAQEDSEGIRTALETARTARRMLLADSPAESKP